MIMSLSLSFGLSMYGTAKSLNVRKGDLAVWPDSRVAILFTYDSKCDYKLNLGVSLRFGFQVITFHYLWF